MKPFLKPRQSFTSKAKVPFRVLNAGCGSRSSRGVHPAFRDNAWQEVRLDIDPVTQPDIVGSIAYMGSLIRESSFDAIWSSHSLEHLYAHEVPLALKGFRRALKPDGFALITTPDLETVAKLVVERGIDEVAYVSPSGPITARDMLFGHGNSIAHGMNSMAHHTGFTCITLSELLLAAGFSAVLAKRERFDLWIVALMGEADENHIKRRLAEAGLDMHDDEEMRV